TSASLPLKTAQSSAIEYPASLNFILATSTDASPLIESVNAPPSGGDSNCILDGVRSGGPCTVNGRCSDAQRGRDRAREQRVAGRAAEVREHDRLLLGDDAAREQRRGGADAERARAGVGDCGGAQQGDGRERGQRH